jgi:NodT family efflux transporter outer membrane factor (OMF) lipoprotein
MRLGWLGVACWSAFFLLGCSKVGPDYEKPPLLNVPKEWSDTQAINTQEWWKIFGDETLNTLIEKAYAQNLDLRTAGLKILQSRASLGISQALHYPQMQTVSASGALMQQQGEQFATISSAFDVAWEMDVWGLYARGVESSQALLYASFASYDAILDSVIAEVARNYINYTTALQRERFARRNIEIQKRVAKMTEVQFNAGNVSELDMQQAKTQLYTTESLLPAYKLAQVQARNALALLLGVTPSEITKILAHTPRGKEKKVAVLADDFQVSASLLQRRPDILVAQYQVEAQNARIGISEAELYPHFSLFGTLSLSANSLNPAWSVNSDNIGVAMGPSLRWNIFQYSRVKNRVRIEDAKLQESILNYNKKVLQAVVEVQNALRAYALTKQQLLSNAQALHATKRAYTLSSTQYENGLVSYQRLLTTVENMTRNEDAYAQIQGNMQLSIVSLYKALGGGWKVDKKHSYLHKLDKEALEKRGVDWGEYLQGDGDE